MAALDPRIEEIRTRYGLSRDDFWELPQKKGTWIAKHAALEVAAVKAKITFLAPQVLEADGAAKSVALCVTGTLDDRCEWSVGEASPANNKNAYPYAMAEKRAKDRVILKLIGLHGLIYSEDEADDFRQPVNAQATAIHTPNTMQRDEDIELGIENYCAQQKAWLKNCATHAEIQEWVELHAPELDRLRRKSLPNWNDLRLFKENRIKQINARVTA